MQKRQSFFLFLFFFNVSCNSDESHKTHLSHESLYLKIEKVILTYGLNHTQTQLHLQSVELNGRYRTLFELKRLICPTLQRHKTVKRTKKGKNK